MELMQHYSCSIMIDGEAISANPSWLDHMSHTGPRRFKNPLKRAQIVDNLAVPRLAFCRLRGVCGTPAFATCSWTRLVSPLRLEFVKYPTSTIIAFKEWVSWAVIRYAVFKGTSKQQFSPVWTCAAEQQQPAVQVLCAPSCSLTYFIL